MEIKRMIAYPTSFWFVFITIPFFSLVQIVFVETIFGQTSLFLGYTKYEAYILFGTFRIVQGISFLFCYYRLSDLKFLIRGDGEETFDAVLIKPIDSQLYATLGRYSFGNVSSIIVGAFIVFYGIQMGHIGVDILHILFYVLLMFMGSLLLYITFLVLNTLIFWFDSLDSLEGVWDSYQLFGQYPSSLYTGVSGVIFNIVIPITLMAGIPAGLLLGKLPLAIFGLYVVIIGFLFYLSRLFWLTAIKRYSSSSS